MTFVKTKIKLAQIAKGDTLEVLLKEGEPLNNVPKSARGQGIRSPRHGASGRHNMESNHQEITEINMSENNLQRSV